jgi:hypothetical protein
VTKVSKIKRESVEKKVLMKMILSSLNLVRKIGVCITSEENGESKLTSEESLFNNLLPTYATR